MNKNENKTDVWRLYESGKDYNQSLDPDYYSTVETNERFAFGDQWKGVKANGIPTPQLNMFKRIINYMIAFLISSKITIKYSVNDIDYKSESEEDRKVLNTVSMLNKIAMQHWEDDKADELIGGALKDSCISGDMGAYVYYDSEIKDFCTELVDGVDVMLGNPNDKRINTARKAVQPYVLVIGRALIDDLKREAKQNGISKTERESIQSDADYDYTAGERGKKELGNGGKSNKATYIIKFWKNHETGTIWYSKSTKGTYIKKDIDTGMKLYPIAWQNWDSRKNSYHGQALLTGFIQNQIFCNRMLALMMVHLSNSAIPKIVYDKTKVSAWNNAVGSAIGVNGDINNIAKAMQPAQMSNQIIETLQFVIKYTMEAMGANEVLLGNVKPENTSAIVQVTQQSSIPLQNQQMNLYDFIEQIAYIWLEHIKAYYKDVTRQITVTDEEGNQRVVDFNAKDILDKNIKVKIDVGPSTYWSEIASVNTLDNLLQQGVLDVIHYLERLPDGYIPQKQELIKDLTIKMQQQEEMQSQEMQFEAQAQLLEKLPPELQQAVQQYIQMNNI